jgi:hypothetical protein
MKKIPTIFERDWNGDRSRVLDEPVPGCEWVFAGEGVATRKYDGSACLVESGVLYKRHEVREGRTTPEGFRQVDDDLKTGKIIGWVPVGEGPEDKWHRDAWARHGLDLPDGTYELVGPKIQGNPEGYMHHTLVRHAGAEPYIVPRTFEGMLEFFAENDLEGIVFQHEDGRMAKIKARDFGLKRGRRGLRSAS